MFLKLESFWAAKSQIQPLSMFQKKKAVVWQGLSQNHVISAHFCSVEFMIGPYSSGTAAAKVSRKYIYY